MSIPTVAAMLSVAMALGVERDERTICTWLPVQKHARATPWTTDDTARAASPESTTRSPTPKPISAAAAVITCELETRRITEPSRHRVSTCTAADSPMSTPAVVSDQPWPTTNSG